MVGTGVFTSLGFQVADITNTWSIILLWSLGGLVAISGAFSYAEIGSLYNRSGGEYHFLSKLYNPVVGYLSGWVSLTVGFAAPVALAAMALGEYIGPHSDVSPRGLAIVVVVLLGIIHSFSIHSSRNFQNATTLLKILLIFGLIVLGLWITPDATGLNMSTSWQGEVLLPAFAISLVYVTYSYTGWNAAAYIVAEIDEPHKNLPKALIRGTVLVMLFYIMLQYVFLRHTPLSALQGQVDVGHIFATYLLGKKGGILISYLISFFLISSISAMIWVGPRVSMVMGEDHSLWRLLKITTIHGVPVIAIWFQILLSIILIVTGTFEQVLIYCGFILQISSALCVYGSFILRKRNVNLSYRSPFYPVFPIIFLFISAWVLLYLILEKPTESILGFANIALGYLTYLWSKKISTK